MYRSRNGVGTANKIDRRHDVSQNSFLPPEKATVKTRHDPRDPLPEGKRPRILYVEDHETMAKSVAAKLRPLPARVDIAFNGLQAVEQIAVSALDDDRYDAIVLDMRVPREPGDDDDVNFGLSLLQKLKEILELTHPSTRYIIYSQYQDVGKCEQCIRLGADSYIPKSDPVTGRHNTSALFARLKELLFPD